MTTVPQNQSPIPHISVPPPILQHHQNIELHVDYLFVNRIPYLHMKSSYINFLSVQTGKIRTKNNIETGIVHVMYTYEARGSRVTSVHGDNAFDLDNFKNKYDQI